MGEPHVISALVAKRAELDGQSIAFDKQKAKIRADIRHIDNALAIFGYRDPPRAIKPKQHKTYRFKRRELSMLIREYEGGTNRDVALRIIQRKDWDAEDRELVAKISDSVKSAKQYQARMARCRP
ncbi:hypothetical protein [Aurantimonas sp. A3-2-R12]|uniref:hypothetical protein n=1 Tax=Aurantimonas sp. A3-2-R12 TaxID=3114362 RepID=UPI002E16D135